MDDWERYETTHNNIEEVEKLTKQNTELLEHIAMLHKDGYTYDQVNRKMIVCECCGKQIMKNIKVKESV